MKRLIEQMSPSAAKTILKKFKDEDSGREAWAAFRQKLTPIPDSGWKYRFQWGVNNSLAAKLQPLKTADELLSGSGTKTPTEWAAALLDELVPLTQDASGCNPGQNPCEFVLYGAELAIYLGASISNWKPAADLLKQGKKILSESMDLFVDEKGLPNVDVLPFFRLVMASWTRLRYFESERNLKLFSEDEKLLYEWTARNLVLLTNADGTQRGAQVSQLDNPEAEIEFFKAVLALDSDADDQNQAYLALPWTPKAKAQAAKSLILTEPCAFSEWSHTAIMQNGWSCTAPSLLLTYTDQDMNLAVSAGGRRLIEGPWKTAVSVAGKKIAPVGEWEQVCYSCEDYYAYLEMELPLESGISLGRTIAMLHEDELLVLADSIRLPESRCQAGNGAGCGTCASKKICTLQNLPSCVCWDRVVNKTALTALQTPANQTPANQTATRSAASKQKSSKSSRAADLIKPLKITCQTSLKLYPGASFESAYDSAEGWIQAGKTQRTVFPLALPEWKSATAPGALSLNRNRELVCQTVGAGVSLFSPLVIDLNPHRAHNAFTWRHLTITQKGCELTPDAACAFRLMIGDDQWLFYQSQCPPAPRAVWGHHLINQTFWGRFIDGEFDPIVEIE